MKPQGSPRGQVAVFFVTGSVIVTSDAWSAPPCALVIWGPAGFTRPPLPTRAALSGTTQPRSLIVAMSPAGAGAGAKVIVPAVSFRKARRGMSMAFLPRVDEDA